MNINPIKHSLKMFKENLFLSTEAFNKYSSYEQLPVILQKHAFKLVLRLLFSSNNLTRILLSEIIVEY